MDTKTFYQKQISLTEWFEMVNHKNKNTFRQEDNDKRERLRVIHELTGLPYDAPVQFPTQDLVKQTPTFKKFLREHGKELCALRLIPFDPTLPKLRIRGLSISEAYKWFGEQDVDASKYKADFVPHSDNPLWSTIFVVNEKGIFGEIIEGSHSQLTQGFWSNPPIEFMFDFKILKMSRNDIEAKKQLSEIFSNLKISDSKKKTEMIKKLGAQFVNEYIKGYFETQSTKEFGLWFIDYNQSLAENFEDFTINVQVAHKSSQTLKGRPASKGKARGRVKIIHPEDLHLHTLTGKEILVCTMTSPDYVHLMRNAAAIVTDQGGILSHAAIIAREFQIPCIVGAIKATKVLKDMDLVEVDANNGIIRILESSDL